ncbi:GIY-YIG nuclease family protein [Planctomycetota bacterium]|nr:GIY-YIG nuclease family protein [Planctomycetota bacterium]
MHYVYLLRSIEHPKQNYVGITQDLNARIDSHNAGRSPHTKRYKPWRCVVAIRFEDKAKAHEFEKYLKSGSGRAFSNRHFF